MVRHILCLIAFCCLLPSIASAEDKFEGAVWKYSMKPAGSSSSDDERAGMFRIFKTDIFQPQGGKPTVIGKIEGKTPTIPNKGGQVKVVFNKLRSGKKGETLACEGQITFQEKGHVTGELVDATGKKWVFKAKRVQE
ncbi:hypothetical protein LOC68_23635 [Blastopirellula sp. JC732]|uniref:Uncharacterized protein n=1 Tax=Blastopirellula sediminis TaxID=2894196 RepID=A0A9X1MRZ3_9BACT|nr:hypothetical protein [Blastopirellula sediminis]MCC9605303.1 hypothetical protein [Blastopirellula sediminis]MCC9631397.1 hypothetical protein [Blastopirellula sediminis]